MKKHPILTVVGVLLVIYLIIDALGALGFMPTIHMQPAPAATASPKPSTVTASMVADMVDGVFKNNFPYSYETKLDEKAGLFHVDIWSSDINADSVEETKNGSYAIWDNMVSNLISTTTTIQNAFDENGHEEITAVLSLCDPDNHDVTYLTIANGVAGFDVVNGVDLLNK